MLLTVTAEHVRRPEVSFQFNGIRRDLTCFRIIADLVVRGQPSPPSEPKLAQIGRLNLRNTSETEISFSSTESG